MMVARWYLNRCRYREIPFPKQPTKFQKKNGVWENGNQMKKKNIYIFGYWNAS